MNVILILLAMGCGSGPSTVAVAPGEILTVCSEGSADNRVAVLVPGLSGCAYGFRKLTPLLHGQGLRTVIIEPLGVGDSGRPHDADYTMTAQAERIGAVLDSLRIDRALFVAQGIGGAIVFRLAVERPGLLTGFVSIEAGAAEIAISPHIRNSLKLAKAVARMGGRSLLRDRFAQNLKKSSGDAGWIDRRAVGRYFRGMGRDIPAAMDVLTAMTRQTEPWGMTSRLPEIGVPVIVLLGSTPHDGALTREDIEDLRRGLAEVEFREIPGAGHFIHEEQPQAVAEAVAQLAARSASGDSLTIGVAPMPGDNGGADLVQAGDPR